MSPALVTLHAYRGGGPFIDITYFDGYDYSAATFVVELRDYADDGAAPRVTLSNAATNAQGVSCTVAYTDGIPVSRVVIRINETTLEGLPFTSPPGGDMAFVYALDVAGGGHPKTRRMRGQLILHAGENA